MLNEERVILMTKLAAYEQNEGRKMVTVGKYFRSDYIGIQVLKSVIGSTVAFIIIFALYILIYCTSEDSISFDTDGCSRI